MHTGPKTYVCTTCDQFFKSYSHLKTQSIIHPGPKTCCYTICDQSFKSYSHLKTHILVNTALTARPEPLCEVLGRRNRLCTLFSCRTPLSARPSVHSHTRCIFMCLFKLNLLVNDFLHSVQSRLIFTILFGWPVSTFFIYLFPPWMLSRCLFRLLDWANVLLQNWQVLLAVVWML